MPRWRERSYRELCPTIAPNCHFAVTVLPIARQIQAAGVTGLKNIANALNDRGVRTARGGALLLMP
jgi:hypothetical protein